MRDEVVEVVEAYIEAVRRNDASLVALHPDVIGFAEHTHVVNRQIVFVRGSTAFGRRQPG